MCKKFTIYIDVECKIGRFIFSKSNLSYFQVEFSHSENSSISQNKNISNKFLNKIFWPNFLKSG